MVEITLATPTGDVIMQSCSSCDRRSWSVAGRDADVGEAMEALATTARRR